MKKNLLILGASSLQVALINKSQELGFNTIVLDLNPDAPGVGIADEFYEVSTIDAEKVLEIARQKNIVGIVTTSDFPVQVVAYVSEQMGLSGLSVDVAKICTNKSLQRELLKKHSFLYPKFKKIKDKLDLDSFNEWQFPLIIKPVDSSASRGVQKVSTFDELLSAYEYALLNSKSGDVIIEEFIVGKEYSVEVLVQNNEAFIVAITEKMTSGDGGKFFVEEVHIVPASLLPEQKVAIETDVGRFISSIGLNNSAAHVEVMVSSNGNYIIEIAARLGGDYITSDLVPLATGVNMQEAIISISVGDKIQSKVSKSEFAGIHFVTPENYEKSKSHLKKINKNENVVHVELKEKVEGISLKSSFDRLGYFIIKAKSRDELDALLMF